MSQQELQASHGLLPQISDLEKELVDLKSPSAEDVSRVLDSYQTQVRN